MTNELKSYQQEEHGIGTFLIFSGHNDRAVVALCRFFCRFQLPFSIIAASQDDQIFKTDWAKYVAFCRVDKNLDLELFRQIKTSVINSTNNDATLIYCPTTEFINHFVLDCRNALEVLDIHITLPAADIYHTLSNKQKSSHLIESMIGLPPPKQLDWSELAAPCVFKPKTNISSGIVLYPVLCLTAEDVELATSVLGPDEWFAQEYITGQSHYLCAYICQDGRRAAFWQTNLMQQQRGKSIVLAKTGGNPGVEEGVLLDELYKMGYFGPFMMEVIQDSDGRNFYIEVNPRFWGPLQLAVDAHPELLALFASDAGCDIPNIPAHESRVYWYSWARGANSPNCRMYPALESTTPYELSLLIEAYDVYARKDTALLRFKH